MQNTRAFTRYWYPAASQNALARIQKHGLGLDPRADTGFAIGIRGKNNNAGTEARVIDPNLKKIDQRDPRGPAPPRPPPGPPRSAPGPAPNTGFGFIGSRPSRCSFLRASLRARRTASAFSRAFFSHGFS